MYISYINKSTNQSGALFTCRNIPNYLPLRQRCKAVSIGNWVTAGPTKVSGKGARFIQAYPGHYLMLRIKSLQLKIQRYIEDCIHAQEMLDGIMALGGAGPEYITNTRTI